MQLIDEAEPSRLTHIYAREWCNNFIPRHPVKKRRTRFFFTRDAGKSASYVCVYGYPTPKHDFAIEARVEANL